MQLAGCYLKGKTAPVTHSPAEKFITDSPVLKDEVQMHVLGGPPPSGPAFPTAPSFSSSQRSQCSASATQESQDHITCQPCLEMSTFPKL